MIETEPEGEMKTERDVAVLITCCDKELPQGAK